MGPLYLLAVMAVSPGRADDPQGEAKLRALMYDFEVTGYCSLVSEAVGSGFQRRERALVHTHSIDEATVTRVRGEAWQAAHAEWQNRGLGGFRAWCSNEGKAAAAALAAP